MADRAFILDLAKLVVAAAWADGELANSEVNALKDLLFGLQELTGDEWAQIELYMDSPVDDAERERLLERVLEQIKSESDRQLVLRTLRQLVEADGVITEDEERALQEIEQAVAEVDTGVFARLAKFMKGAIGSRGEESRGGQREDDIEDFIKNRVYYQLKSKLEKEGMSLDLPDEAVRKLCFAAGLLARVSAVDEDMSDAETHAAASIMQSDWGLSSEEAKLVAQISRDRAVKGLDDFRVANGFYQCTTRAERQRFLVCLFKVANACGKTSHDETEEIRKISNRLKLDHKDFINAKLTVPDEDREVL